MRSLTSLLFLCLATAEVFADETKSPNLQVGAAAVDITPKQAHRWRGTTTIAL
jgi:hypothetical protein